MKSVLTKILSVSAAALVAIAFTLGGHGNTSARGSHASLPVFREDNWVSSNLALARTLDPAQISEAADYNVVGLVQQDLVTINSVGNAVPDLAKSWTVSKNKKVWTFTLRHARFSNGDPVTAADAVYSIRAANAPSTHSGVAPYYDALIKNINAFNAGKSNSLGVKAIGKYQVQITTSKPAAYFLKALTYPVNDVLDPKVLKGANRTVSGNTMTSNCQKNVGTGPFTFKCQGSNFYKAGTTPYYTLVPNKHYFGPKPKIELHVGVAGTSETAYNQYKAGALDIVGVPSQFLAQAKKLKNQFYQVRTSAVYYTSLNTQDPPFNNVNCRLAYAYSINRAQLAAIVHHTEIPQYDIIPKSKAFLGYVSPSKLPGYDPAKAKSYFAKGGSVCATPYEYKYVTGSQDADNSAAAEVAMTSATGFKVTQKGLNQNDWDNVVSQAMSKTGTEATFDGWIMDYPDSQDYITLLFSCGEGYNIGEWCNKKFTNLADKADATFNPRKRAQLYAQAQTIALNQGYPVMELNGLTEGLLKPYVKGGVTTFACGGWCPPSTKNGLADWSKITIAK